jgi:hypothetical protein
LPFDWGSKVESALRIFGADRALLLIEGVAIAKVVMLGFAYPSAAAGGKTKRHARLSWRFYSKLTRVNTPARETELFRHRQGACENPELSRRVTPVVCRR